MNKNSFLKVYISALPSKYEGKALYPKERQNEIERTRNLNHRKQKYFAWRLLEHAITKDLNHDFNSVIFSVNQTGKWSCNICHFSISHCDEVIAVAISNEPLGIDIEKIVHPKSNFFANRTLTTNELEKFSSLPTDLKTEFLIKKWTQKEAVYKFFNHESFVPSQIDTDSFNVFSKKIELCNSNFFLSVYTQSSIHPTIMDTSSKLESLY